MKKLICYFSATGTTKKVAEKISNYLEEDIFEIEPVEKYTREDLDWKNDNSRSSIEMNDKNSRPSIKNKIENLSDYDTIIIGYPIWWYVAPTIINTFIEENDLENKNIYIFATSGSSSIEDSFSKLKETYPKLNFIKAKRFSINLTNEEIEELFK